MESCMSAGSLSHGHVFHARHGDKKNSFRYPVFTLVMQTTEANRVYETFKKIHRGVLSLRARDFLNGREGALDECIRTFLKEGCGYEADEVWLQTFPRMFGYAFNPITFWFCKRNGYLDAVLCEVNNTFGERHFYWVKGSEPILSDQWLRAEKMFHVSPFYPVDGYYKFRFKFEAENSRVDISYYGDDDSLRLTTWVAGSFQDLEKARLIELLLRYGWMTPLVVFRIHWQAVRLWLKKVKFYSKPQPPGREIT